MGRRKKSEVNINNKTVTHFNENTKEIKKIPLNHKQVAEILYSKKLNLKCKNKKQKDYIQTKVIK